MRRLRTSYGKYGIITRQRLNDLAKEIFRKAIHICSAFIPFLLSVAYAPVLIALGTSVILYSVFEFCRLKGRHIPLISSITAAAARKRDENKFVLGPVTLVLGIIAASLLWPLPYASIGIFALAFGDGLASLAGKLFGRVHIPLTEGKTVAGSITCFTAIFITSFLACGNTKVALILAWVGMFMEVLPLKDFDNLIIPIVIGGLSKYLLI